ncbi:helix-turn-helix domain-containing protein [Sorangium sp. So ce590]|uniref:helix-turn-helix domain-containing protein n=1 Tax=unclassified Sorangium TaxID=2621164 RepID=UPI003F63DE95
MAGHPNGLLYAESLGLALAVRLLGRFAAPSRPPPRAVSAAAAAPHGVHRGAPRPEPVPGPAGRRRRDQRVLPQDQRSTGLPVHEYVVRRRVERVKALLSRGDLPASQVAIEAGFAHQSHMARCMRRVPGVTPTALARRSPRR